MIVTFKEWVDKCHELREVQKNLAHWQDEVMYNFLDGGPKYEEAREKYDLLTKRADDLMEEIDKMVIEGFEGEKK